MALLQSHDRKAFDCGEESLNSYLQRFARQNANRLVGITFVAVLPAQPERIAGYFTLSTSHIARELLTSELPLPRYSVPAVLLARLAVDRDFQGLGVGGALLSDVFSRVSRFASEVGLYALEVSALHRQARAFYERFGFLSLADEPDHLYLSVEKMRKLHL